MIKQYKNTHKIKHRADMQISARCFYVMIELKLIKNRRFVFYDGTVLLLDFISENDKLQQRKVGGVNYGVAVDIAVVPTRSGDLENAE